MTSQIVSLFHIPRDIQCTVPQDISKQMSNSVEYLIIRNFPMFCKLNVHRCIKHIDGFKLKHRNSILLKIQERQKTDG